jgi:hypothetical protein
MTTFATDLDHLIRTHVGTPKCGDDLLPIVEALYEAANRVARQGDHYRWRDEFEDGGQKLVLCGEAESPTQRPQKPRKLARNSSKSR